MSTPPASPGEGQATDDEIGDNVSSTGKFSGRARKILSRLRLSKVDLSDSGDATLQNSLFAKKSWRGALNLTPRTPTSYGAIGGMFRTGPLMPGVDPSMPVTPPATLIAPADEAARSMKAAIESGQGIDSKRLFRSLVTIENLEV